MSAKTNISPLTAEEIEEVRAAARATDWDEEWEVEEGQIISRAERQVSEDEWITDESEIGYFCTAEDMAFAIACQPRRALQLIATIDALRAELETEREKTVKFVTEFAKGDDLLAKRVVELENETTRMNRVLMAIDAHAKRTRILK